MAGRERPELEDLVGFFVNMLVLRTGLEGNLPFVQALSRVRESVPSIAEVASTAVKSDTSVPTPRVSAKPFTPPVAIMKRMNATPIVTTFASAIVRRALP